MILRCLLLLIFAGVVEAAPQTVVLVRHAEKATEPTGDPALSTAGQTRAQQLAEALANAGVGVIFTTQFRRTRDTAAPLANKQGIVSRVIDAGGETAAHVAAVAAAVREAEGTVLVVGHSNTVPDIVAALGGPALPPLCDTSFSQVFVLHDLDGTPRLQRWRYGAADATGQAGCL